MDQRAIDALVAAGLNNRLQVFGALYYWDEGTCALGVILEAVAKEEGLPKERPWSGRCPWVSHSAPEVSCPQCGECYTEERLILHCNDAHRWDFLTMARKLEHLVTPPSESP